MLRIVRRLASDGEGQRLYLRFAADEEFFGLQLGDAIEIGLFQASGGRIACALGGILQPRRLAADKIADDGGMSRFRSGESLRKLVVEYGEFVIRADKPFLCRLGSGAIEARAIRRKGRQGEEKCGEGER